MALQGVNAKRRLVQSLSFVLLHANFWSVAAERFCLPVMNCEACALAWFGCPIGMIGRSVSFLEVPWVVLGIVLFFGVLLGRFLCGWVCPMGFFQDLMYKIPGLKFRLPRFLLWFKYAFLVLTVIVVAAILGMDTLLFYCSSMMVTPSPPSEGSPGRKVLM